MKIVHHHVFKNGLLIGVLAALTVLLNIQILTYHAMYFEQPILYAANQPIHSFKSLLSHYLHPQFLHIAIPFFRPSGHYLLYFILAPLAGWQNMQAFFVVNLLFLALSGWFIIRIYQLLFPGYKTGGYIAYAIYLMHPAMVISRLTVMHFEYAHVFFILASLYFFIQFTLKNTPEKPLKQTSYFVLAIVFWVVSTTFKEAALMLGPVLFLFFCMVPVKKNFRALLTEKDTRQILLILMVMTAFLFFYITAPWPDFLHSPARGTVDISLTLAAARNFVKTLFGFDIQQQMEAYHYTANPLLVSVVMLAGLLLTFGLWASKPLQPAQKSRLVFLALAACLFLILPLLWGMSYAWHFNMAILLVSLIFGFVIETMLPYGLLIAMLIACITPLTNAINIQFLDEHAGLEARLNQNAVFHPPLAKSRLTPDSIIVVEDRLATNPYRLGASAYPLMAMPGYNTTLIQKINSLSFVQYHATYNGYLFPYAYLMPSLREEEYPFSIEKMAKVPDPIFYTWVKNYNKIVCFGYDDQGNWHDKTALFKAHLLAEQTKRQLVTHSYQEIPGKVLQENYTSVVTLSVQDAEICQFHCDQTQACKGFVMLDTRLTGKMKPRCLIYSDVRRGTTEDCVACTVYIKNA